MTTAPISAPQYFIEGFRFMLRPGLRAFVVLPLLINLLVFGGLIAAAWHEFDYWVNYFMPSLPDWASFLTYILWPLFALLVLVMVFFTFTIFANLIAAPFNGFLAEKVEIMARGEDRTQPFRFSDLAPLVGRSIARELRKLAYFAPRAIALLILSFIPGINLIAAPLWLVFGAWMMAVQYIDYPCDNNQVSFPDMLAWLRQRRMGSLGFGGVVYVATLIPLANLLCMPAAVTGATLFWVREETAPAAA
ncbi:sulfate transporter CysZ [Atopomonas sediminilitoris]|uniref:sulfate transporter CysZ n=1 Tax=Atopomonas sediminilitoris TaxID=2919919 RepID=UPI001F4D43EE|nr:sulfate transporter CysZ [Atopomonas sediminilitoris]